MFKTTHYLFAALVLVSAVPGAAREGDEDWPIDLLFVSGEFDERVPAPQATIGHAVGARPVRYADLVRYLVALSEASPYVMLDSYAESHEGRRLYHLTISSERNLARLDQIRRDNARLADPRQLSSNDEAERIIAELPGIAWMSYGIHGDELSSTDAAMQVAYVLAASTHASIAGLRDEMVIHLDPVMNPDGRERYLSQMQQLSGRVPNPDYQSLQHGGLWSAGRGNHYLFDLNRDWLMQVHPETRGRVERIRDWNPHLLVDSHEMGGLSTYLFDPPREPYSLQLSESNMSWRRRFSADQAAAFDRRGWSYYTGEWYEEWYPGYTNAWANLRGTIGILYEQAGVDGSAVRQATGALLTYREAVEHHAVSSFANMDTLQRHRRDVLRDFMRDRRQSVAGEGPGPRAYFVRPSADHTLTGRLVELLDRQGVEMAVASEAFKAPKVTDLWGRTHESADFPEGTLILDTAQPLRRLIHAIFEFDPRMTEQVLMDERTHLETGKGSRVYDVTAWNLPMAYGLDAFQADRLPSVSTRPARVDAPRAPFAGEASAAYGYLVDGADSDIHLAVTRMFESRLHARVATKRFKYADRVYNPGAVLLRRHENPADLPAQLARLAKDLNVAITPARGALSQEGPDLGGEMFTLLQAPRVAIASQWPISTMAFGTVWHALDVRLGLRTSPINVQQIGGIDLRKYNVLVLPSSDRLGSAIDDAARKSIRAWVEGGGTLIAMGGSAAFLARKASEISAVRLRRDVLEELDAYAEAVERERDSRNVRIDMDRVWAKPSADEMSASDDETPGAADVEGEGTPGDKKAEKGEPEGEALKRLDAFRRLFSPQGAFAAAEVDNEHWLAFGANRRMPALVAGDFVYLSRAPVQTPVRLASADAIRLGGLMWPEARTRLGDSAYATVERLGHGQVILFASEPFFRGYCEGTGRLFFNAVLYGPGMGTSQPLPW